ncbi:RHS repeat-associated core domain-containing protein, partial [Actinokineospora sp.]|uniref:RHS repeat-associated core domain-containing protein n=1 Tax=Actinokineospora sp. TaxID=1872133 RepID=UPI003D6BF3D7
MGASSLSFVPQLLDTAEDDFMARMQAQAVKTVTPITVPERPVAHDDATSQAVPAKVTWPAGKVATITATTARSYLQGSSVWVESQAGEVTSMISLADQDTAAKAGVSGVVVTATPQTGGKARVGVDYADFGDAYGGDYGARLRLTQLPHCALTTPDKPECRTQTPLDSTNDTVKKTVSAPVDMQPNQPMVLAAVAASDPASGGGSFSATSLSAEGSWAGGSQSGSFTYGYPITVPPAMSALVPQVGLSYDSGVVDGKTASTTSQASWVGDGWNTPSSFIEQTFVPCADSPGGTPSPVATQDLCYSGEILTLSLNGSSSALVWDASKGTYRSTGDDGAVITKVVNSGNNNGTYNTSYWKVVDRSGSTFHFGLNRLPGWVSGKAETNSVASVPVFSSHPGDPCHNAAGFSSSKCTMAYRWNLDYVTDIHSHAMAYHYLRSVNYYGLNNGAQNVSYHRDSYLTKIEYGFTNGNAYNTPPNQVVFTTGPRCVSGTCSPLSAATAVNWPDVPYDLNCASGATCATRSPSFWSTQRLTTITTKQWTAATATYATIDSYALNLTIPTTGNATKPTLWLADITRTGHDTSAGGSTNPITLPSTSFASLALPNRVNSPNDGLVAYTRHRISNITTTTGAGISVEYSPQSDCVGPVTTEPSTNTSRCFPVKWTPPGRTTPIVDWFRKYAVTAVNHIDNTGGNPAVRTTYAYTGPAWRYDDNEVVKAADRTWGQWRGYAEVAVRTGADGGPKTLSETTYYQGMDGDTLPGGATRSVTLTDSQAGQHRDTDQFAGSPLETTAYLGDGGPVDNSTITSYWLSPATATRSRTGLPALTANYSGTATTWSRQAITSGPGTTWRITQTDQTYDVNTGLPLFTYSHGDVTQAAQATCTATTYAPSNTGLNLVGLVAEVEVLAKPCGGLSSNGGSAPTPAQTNALTAPSGVNRPTDVITNSRIFYDNPTLAQTWPQPANPTWPQAAPTRGDVSVVRVASDYNSGYTYKTSGTTVYDNYGRPTSTYDAAGAKTSTSFTPSTGIPTTIQTTNALGHKATTTLQSRRGLALGTSDANSITTTAKYDALGRLTEGWLAGRPTTKPADVKFSYLLSKVAPSAVQSNKLNESDGYITSYTIYDSLMRESQTQVPSPLGGRLLTNTMYDSHGWAYEKYNAYWDSDPNHFPGPDLVKSPMNQIRNHSRITFDGLGRPVRTDSMDRDAVITSTTTVHNGDRTTVIPPTGATTTSTIVDGLGRTTTLQQYTSAPQLSTPSNTFTGIHRISGGTQQSTQFTFDNKGRPHQRVDSAGNTWTTSYNLLGQVTAQTDPDAGTTTTTYDGAGRVATTTDARGQVLAYGYDALGRKKSQSLGDGTVLASWSYDSEGVTPALPNSIGKLTASSSYVRQNGTSYAYTHKSTLGFTNYGQPLDNTTVIPANEGLLAGTYTFEHFYGDSISLPMGTDYPAHGGLPFEPFGFSYSGALDLLSGIAGLTGYQNQVLHDAFGRPDEIHLNAAKVSVLRQRYDAHDSRLLERWLMRAEGTPLEVERTSFGYDPAGNVTRETTSRLAGATETQCYRYDNLVRLRSAWTGTDGCAADPASNSGATVGGGFAESGAYWTEWDIDPIGNRTKQTQHGVGGAADTVTTYAYPPSGAAAVRPHALQSSTTTGPGANTSSYTYDNAGNTRTRVLPAGNQDLTWSPTGRLDTVTTPGQSTNYVYGADGDQLLRRDPGQTTLFLHNTELTLNTSTNTVTGRRFYHLSGGAQAIRTGSGVNYKYELSTRHDTGGLALDNTAQTPTWRASTPYGEPRGTQPSAWPDTHRFLDKPHSTTTGLTDIGARKYDQNTGRFISVDPIMDPADPQQWNGYTYANNNPITFSDPTGLIADYDNPHQEKYLNATSTTAKQREIGRVYSKLKKKVAVKSCDAMCHVGGFAYGVGVTAKNTVVDLGKLAGNVGECMNFASRVACAQNMMTAGQIAQYAWNDPLGFGYAVADGMTKDIREAWKDGRYGEALGRGSFSLVELAVGSRGLSKLGKLGKVDAPCVNSFDGDTPVLMADGATKPISDIIPGDQVQAADPETGREGPREVTATWPHMDTMYVLVFADGSTIDTTEDHPFWNATDQQWQRADALNRGDQLLAPDGQFV